MVVFERTSKSNCDISTSIPTGDMPFFIRSPSHRWFMSSKLIYLVDEDHPAPSGAFGLSTASPREWRLIVGVCVVLVEKNSARALQMWVHQAITSSLFQSSTILMLNLFIRYYLQLFPFHLIHRGTGVSY